MRRRFNQRDAFWTVLTQSLIVLIFCLIVWGAHNAQAAGSSLVGGLICVLPNIYLYRRVFAFFGAREAKKIFNAFFRGEFVKFLLTAAGFVAALSIPWITPLWLFVGFIAAQGGFWVAPILIGLGHINKTRQMRSRWE